MRLQNKEKENSLKVTGEKTIYRQIIIGVTPDFSTVTTEAKRKRNNNFKVLREKSHARILYPATQSLILIRGEKKIL